MQQEHLQTGLMAHCVYHFFFYKSLRSLPGGPCTAEPVSDRDLGPGVRTDGQGTFECGEITEKRGLFHMGLPSQTILSGICKRDLYYRTPTCRAPWPAEGTAAHAIWPGTARGEEKQSLDGEGLPAVRAAAQPVALRLCLAE